MLKIFQKCHWVLRLHAISITDCITISPVLMKVHKWRYWNFRIRSSLDKKITLKVLYFLSIIISSFTDEATIFLLRSGLVCPLFFHVRNKTMQHPLVSSLAHIWKRLIAVKFSTFVCEIKLSTRFQIFIR